MSGGSGHFQTVTASCATPENCPEAPGMSGGSGHDRRLRTFSGPTASFCEWGIKAPPLDLSRLLMHSLFDQYSSKAVLEQKGHFSLSPFVIPLEIFLGLSLGLVLELSD